MMDAELTALLKAASEADESFDWGRLARALQRRGFPLPCADEPGLGRLRERAGRALATAIERAPRLLATEAGRLFEAHPELREFSWTQYSPHWSDGEPCHFRAWTRYAQVNGVDEYSKEGKALAPLMETVREVLATFSDDDLMLELFGERSTVRVTREGVFREYYEHEY